MPSSPVASTSRQPNSQTASNRPSRRTRSARGVSADLSSPTSSPSGPSVPHMTDAFPAFLPHMLSQGQFASQHQPPIQGSAFPDPGDGHMAFHAHLGPRQQQLPLPPQPHTLHHVHAHAHAGPGPGQRIHPQQHTHIGASTGEINPLPAFADQQVCTPPLPGYHGRVFPDPPTQ